jgi:hypothetical protein
MAECGSCGSTFATQRGVANHSRYCSHRKDPIPRLQVVGDVLLETGQDENLGQYDNDLVVGRIRRLPEAEEAHIPELQPHFVDIFHDVENGESENAESEHGEEAHSELGEEIDLDRNPDLKYVRLQEELYRHSYNVRALQDSVDLESFINCLEPYSTEDVVMSRLLHFKNRIDLSRAGGNELLLLLSSFSNGDYPIPSTWKSVLRYVRRKCNHLDATTLRRVIPWPAAWNMGAFREGGCSSPEEVELIVRDPLELVATALVCPVLQYLNQTECLYDYSPGVLDDGSPCWSGVMSSSFAKYTQAEIRKYNPEGVLVPIITYADGVSLGLRNKVSMSGKLYSRQCYVGKVIFPTMLCRESYIPNSMLSGNVYLRRVSVGNIKFPVGRL